MLISTSLHNSLIILSIVIAVLILGYICLKQLRKVWHHVSIIYNVQRNVLLLESPQLSELINVLSTVNDDINIHPRQIRRLLRQALDSNIVKDVPVCTPSLHLKRPTFYKNDQLNQYILKFNHIIHDQINNINQQICFDFYFGVPKSYYFQLKSITKSLNKNNILSKQNEQKIKITKQIISSPLQSLVSFAKNNHEQPMRIQRLTSESLEDGDLIINKDYDDDLDKLPNPHNSFNNKAITNDEGYIVYN